MQYMSGGSPGVREVLEESGRGIAEMKRRMALTQEQARAEEERRAAGRRKCQLAERAITQFMSGK
jgi:hypothetical protein